MIFPLWAMFGMAAALLSTCMPLIQERMKADGYALAFWNKIFTALLMVPFVLQAGLPSDPAFYVTVALTAILWCVADVVYFRSIPVVGAGVITRMVPSAIIVTFFLWFLFDPALLRAYIADPGRSALIAGIIVLSSFFAVRLKRCPVTWQAIGVIWPLLFAAAVGPIIQKISLSYAATPMQAPYAFVFVQALVMVAIWGAYYLIRRPVPVAAMRAGLSIRTAALVSVFSGFGVVLKNFGLLYAENPAYLSVLLLTDSLIVLAYHRLTGRRDGSDVLSGLGVVACAAALIIVKSLK